MGDIVIKTGDSIQITVSPPAIVPALAAPVPLVGSGARVLVAGQPVCLLGDELPPALRAPLPYTAPPFVTPGTGTLSVMLTPTNMTRQTMNGSQLLIKGGTFTVQFQVMAPAMQPTPGGPVPDPMMVKPGTAQLLPTTPTIKAG